MSQDPPSHRRQGRSPNDGPAEQTLQRWKALADALSKTDRPGAADSRSLEPVLHLDVSLHASRIPELKADLWLHDIAGPGEPKRVELGSEGIKGDLAPHLEPELLSTIERFVDRKERRERETAFTAGARLRSGMDTQGIAALFDQLVRRLPLRFGTLGVRLRFAGEAAVEPAWMDTANGQCLALQIGSPPREGRVLAVHERLYLLDSQRSEIWALDMPARAYELLLHAPPVPDELVPQVQARLDRSAMPRPLPRLQPPVETPDIQLPLGGLARIQNPQAGTMVIEMAFEYGGHRAPSEAWPNFTARAADGKRIRIARDLDRESALIRNASAIADDHPTAKVSRVGEQAFSIEVAPAIQAQLIVALIQFGFEVERAEGRRIQIQPSVDSLSLSIDEEANHWLEVGLGVDIQGRRVNLLPFLRGVLEAGLLELPRPVRESPQAVLYMPVDDEQVVPVRKELLREMIAPIIDWVPSSTGTALRLPRASLAALAPLASAAAVNVRAGSELRERLDHWSRGVETVALPPEFKGDLRPYQQDALDWMGFLAQAGIGGLLADDMGLGKTVQAIAHMVVERNRSGRNAPPMLVVVMKSVLQQWESQIRKFAPGLRCLRFHGAERRTQLEFRGDYDVILTTFQVLARDVEVLAERRFGLCVIDETRNIKNHRSQASQALRTLKFDRILALGGTPVENHLLEFWSVLDVVEPGVLGTLEEFTRHFRTPIEKHADDGALQRLRQRIALVFLRRTKAQVNADLPKKVVQDIAIQLGSEQRQAYESIRIVTRNDIQTILAQNGLASGAMLVLTRLLRLRQLCCSPRLIHNADFDNADSAKEEWLAENLPILAGQGRRMLLFTEFSELIPQIEAIASQAGVAWVSIRGTTSTGQRASALRDFKSGKAQLFILAEKAGGIGLDLPEADTVIHLEPDWNPGLEDQAIDRAHRIGNPNESLFIYRLIATGSIEEQVLAYQARKRSLADAVVGGELSQARALTAQDVEAFLRPLVALGPSDPG